MENTAVVEQEVSEGQREAAPYLPSWVNRFTDWVDRLVGPSWLFYGGLWLVLYLVEIATQWTNGSSGTFYIYHLFFVGTIPYDLALIHYLDKRADAALSRFRSVLDCDDHEYADLRYRLTTLPPRPALIAALIGVMGTIVFIIVYPVEARLRLLHFTDTTASIYYNSVIGIVVWACVAVVLYHTMHQLRVVSQIYRRARVNLFNLGPLYTFSDLSARTAIGTYAIAYAWFVAVPEFSTEPAFVLIGLHLLIFGVVTFVWPLLGVHNLLVDEKNRLMTETSKRLEATIADLHQRLDSNDLREMDNLNKAISSLELEFGALKRISTWPWQSETLRWLIAAVLFPVIVWLLQWVLQRILV